MAAAILRPFLWLALLVAAVIATVPAHAQTPAQQVQTAWRLLDYIAVDYREAVADARIINQLEYDEMIEFSGSVSEKLAALPAKPERPALIEDARALEAAIAAKAEPADIARRVKGLSQRLLAAYPVPLAPAQVPDLARGAALYTQNCASCHGAKGEGAPLGSDFAKLDPPPIAFADRERARDRSLFGLYQVVTQGLEGTAMQSYASLPEEDRWALAFHTGTLAYGDAAAGERIWREDASVRALVPDLAALVALAPAELEAKIGADKAAAVVAYLRANPDAVTAGAGGSNASLQLARDRLRESVAAYSRGDRAEANQLALSAYLDGF